MEFNYAQIQWEAGDVSGGSDGLWTGQPTGNSPAPARAGFASSNGGSDYFEFTGSGRPNAVKFFSSIELITLLADSDWLDDATKTIGQFWKRKNARRNGLITGERADAVAVVR